MTSVSRSCVESAAWIAALVILTLMLVSVVLSISHYQKQRRVEEIQDAVRAVLLEQQSK